MLEPDLLVTKFTIPPVRSMLLHRPRLLTILDQSYSVPLMLLSAPAGFGKTTLLSTWATLRRQNTAVAWVTLDEHDNDPTRFWSYVIAAFKKSAVPIGEAALTMLHSPQPARLSAALTMLINELAEQSMELALILDDYHLIREPALQESLQFMLDHLPACLHLILASRVEPALSLARLRAKGQMVEIHEAELSLNNEETAKFLTKVMKLSLSEEDIDLLQRRTEGWVAGLQLAALSMRRYTDISAFIKTFAGSHRLILDYVREEIIDPLPEDRQRFLLHTAILDRMNAEVCQALTGALDSQFILEEIERANLFLIPLDEERRWYRFHTLFREVLLVRLQSTQPDLVQHLHRKAALWYQRQGLPHEAIPHALATDDSTFLAELLEGCIERLGLQGEMKTLLTWLKRLPLAVLRARPRLATSYILLFYMMFPFPHQEEEERERLHALQKDIEKLALSQDQDVLSGPEQELLHHRLIILDGWKRVSQALSESNVEQMNNIAEQWQSLPRDEDALWQFYRLVPFAMAWRAAGNFLPMVAAMQEGRKFIRATQNPYLEVQILWGQIAALIGLGQLSQAQARCQDLQLLVGRLGAPLPIAAYVNLFQAQLAYIWNDVEVAKNEALLALEKTGPLQYLDILMGSYEVLGHCYIAQGDLIRAERTICEMERTNEQVGLPLFHPWIEALWVRLWLAQGALRRMQDWAEHTPYRETTIHYSRESIYLALVRVYIALQHYPQALQMLSMLLNNAEQVERKGSIIPILALQVAALQASGATLKAQQVLFRLLSLAEPEKYVRVFLDAGEPMQQTLRALLAENDGNSNVFPVPFSLVTYASHLLTAFDSQQAQHVQQGKASSHAKTLPSTSSCRVQPLLEPLTPREQEVLLLLAEGASNQEIARQLIISLATVKKHVSSIMSKLGARNRTQVIVHARLHSLL